jgi:hypothetical protein
LGWIILFTFVFTVIALNLWYRGDRKRMTPEERKHADEHRDPW